jgi:predicted RNA binding protein YcfA (HicA-like mRNA interferase family)
MIAALKREGFEVVRQKGSHVSLQRTGLLRPVVVPLHRELSDGVVTSCLKTAGISRKRYLELLGKRKPR